MISVFKSCFILVVSICIGSMIFVGCSDQAFQINSKPNSYSGNTGANQEGSGTDGSSQPGVSIGGGTQNPQDTHDPSISYISENPLGYVTFKDTSSKEDGAGNVIKTHLAIMFLIDKTGSMSKYIATVRDNVKTFVTNLNAKSYDVKLGFITYEDSITSTFELNSNVEAFKNSVDTIGASGGGAYDGPESGLTAIIEGAQKLNASSFDSYLKIMVLISDNFSHGETSASYNNRNCSIDSTVNVLNSFSSKFQQQTKLFYSVPNDRSAGCLSYPNYNYTGTPRFQMDDLVGRIFPQAGSGAAKGGYLGWEFNATTFKNTLPNMIEEITPSQLLCLTNSIEIKLSSTLSVNYNVNSFKQAYELYKRAEVPSSAVYDRRIIDLLKGLASSQRVADATQSCFEMEDVRNNNFNYPKVTNRKVRIPFEFRQQ